MKTKTKRQKAVSVLTLDRLALAKAGVRNETHQMILLERLPFGETVEQVLADKTIVQVNAPRALIAHAWQAQFSILARLEKIQAEGGTR